MYIIDFRVSYKFEISKSVLDSDYGMSLHG